MPTIRMLRLLSGSRDGAEWPPIGGTLDVPASEADDLERARLSAQKAPTISVIHRNAAHAVQASRVRKLFLDNARDAERIEYIFELATDMVTAQETFYIAQTFYVVMKFRQSRTSGIIVIFYCIH